MQYISHIVDLLFLMLNFDTSKIILQFWILSGN